MWDINPFSNISWASKSITTQSALNPVLWLCGVCVPGSIISAIFVPGDLGWVISLTLLAAVPTAIIAYFALLVFAPDRLHSERHQQEMRKMALLGDSRVGGTLLDQTPVNNPMLTGPSDDR